jgi:hypothetical protein
MNIVNGRVTPAASHSHSAASSQVLPSSLAADTFVPHSVRSQLVVAPTVLLYGQSWYQSNDDQLYDVRRQLVPFLGCTCADPLHDHSGEHPPHRRVILPDLHFAIQDRIDRVQSPVQSQEKVARVDDITSMEQYCTIFESLLTQERKEVLRQFERYTQFNHVASFKGTGSASSCHIVIQGLSDAKPQVQAGDILLLQPCIAMTWPIDMRRPKIKTPPVQILRVFCLVTNVERNYKIGDIVHANWLDTETAKVFQENLRVQRFHVRLVPSPESYIRCLTALDWLKQTIPSAMDLFFPTTAPVLAMKQDLPHKLKWNDALNYNQNEFLQMVMTRTTCPETKSFRGPMVLTGPAGTG